MEVGVEVGVECANRGVFVGSSVTRTMVVGQEARHHTVTGHKKERMTPLRRTS